MACSVKESPRTRPTCLRPTACGYTKYFCFFSLLPALRYHHENRMLTRRHDANLRRTIAARPAGRQLTEDSLKMVRDQVLVVTEKGESETDAGIVIAASVSRARRRGVAAATIRGV